MSELTAKVFGFDGADKGTTPLPEELFGKEPHEHLLWLAVKRHLGNQRQGNAKVKNKGEVSGGGRKPWRQKGTGRARSGSNTSPLWPGGGRAFGPEPRSYYTDLPRKQRRAALFSALSLKASEHAVTIIDALELNTPRTAEVAGMLQRLGLADKRTLLILGETNPNVLKSCRNLPKLTTRLAHDLNPYELLHCEVVLMTQSGFDRMKEVFVT